MDLGIFGQIHFTWDFFVGFLSIILIDLILAGDNAVIIAMAVRSLPRKQRMRGIAFGAGAAVILRVILTFFAAQLLQIQFIKFIGGAVIVWIAVKLFVEGAPDEEAKKEAKTLLQAIWVIIIADLTMSTDNVLAVAGASKGNLFLLLFGLGLSIPFVVFTSNLLSLLMDKYSLHGLSRGRCSRESGRGDDDYRSIYYETPPSVQISPIQCGNFFYHRCPGCRKVWIKWKRVREEQVFEPQSPQETLNSPKEE